MPLPHNSGSDIYVVNHNKGFIYTRSPRPGEHISGGRDSYQIEAFGTVQVELRTPNGPLMITLVDVAYIPGFLTNVVALDRLNKGGVHWDSERPSILKRNGTVFGYLEQVGRHWVLQKDLMFTAESHAVCSTTRKSRIDKGVKKSAKPLDTTISADIIHNLSHLIQSRMGKLID